MPRTLPGRNERIGYRDQVRCSGNRARRTAGKCRGRHRAARGGITRVLFPIERRSAQSGQDLVSRRSYALSPQITSSKALLGQDDRLGSRLVQDQVIFTVQCRPIEVADHLADLPRADGHRDREVARWAGFMPRTLPCRDVTARQHEHVRGFGRCTAEFEPVHSKRTEAAKD